MRWDLSKVRCFIQTYIFPGWYVARAECPAAEVKTLV